MNIESRLPSILIEAEGLVRREGAVLRAEFHRPGGPRGVGNKADVDCEIEQRLRSGLLALLQCDWVAEEGGVSLSGHPCRWIVDPHDGTRAFLSGLRGSSISVALFRGDEPLLGIVHAPLAPDDDGDFFSWAAGGPLIRNGRAMPRLGTSSGQPLVVALNDRTGDYARDNHQHYYPARILALPSIAYRLALAAAGEVDVGLSLTNGIEDYDVAGGHALLHGAGGHVLQLDGSPLRYAERRWFLGCAGGRQSAVADIVSRGSFAAREERRTKIHPVSPVGNPAILKRVHGAILGQLCGDALGSLVEFRSPADIAAAYPLGVSQMVDGGTWNTIAGQPTDDGEMALALARSILARGDFSAQSAAKAYIDWLSSDPFDIGSTTRRGIQALMGRGEANRESEANGALMRVSPLGILEAGDPRRAALLAGQDAALTHPNAVCIAASSAFAAAVAVGIETGDRGRMWRAALDHAGQNQLVCDVLERAPKEAPPDYQSAQGHVVIALQNAFHHLCAGSSVEQAVTGTISCGGDTDTNAAICGALLGSADGRDAIPTPWRLSVLTCRPVSAAGVYRPRPPVYWPDDALEIAEALYATGRREMGNAAHV